MAEALYWCYHVFSLSLRQIEDLFSSVARGSRVKLILNLWSLIANVTSLLDLGWPSHVAILHTLVASIFILQRVCTGWAEGPQQTMNLKHVKLEKKVPQICSFSACLLL